jgi:hypothetical protein
MFVALLNPELIFVKKIPPMPISSTYGNLYGNCYKWYIKYSDFPHSEFQTIKYSTEYAHI